MGNMGKYHANYLLGNKINRCVLTAVSDAFTANLEPYKQLKTFDDAGKMIRSGEIDAVIIASTDELFTA